MNNLKSILLVLSLGFFAACGALKPVQKETIANLNPAYDYAPPESGFLKSKNISFILMTPNFAKAFALYDYGPFTSFSKSMADDYVEMLTKRGYRYKGPINSYDELVYADKKNADLLLETELAFELNGATPFNRTVGRTLIGNMPYERYYAKGDQVLTGKINFYISEPFTHTKIWVKSIPIEAQKLSFNSTKKDYSSLSELLNDSQVWNTYIIALKNVYAKALQTAWNYLDPEELELKKKEAEEVRKNSSFQKN